MISGDRGGQGVGPSLPIHLFGNVVSKTRRTCEPQCGDAPSFWKIIPAWNPSEVQRNFPTCPCSFLVLNLNRLSTANMFVMNVPQRYVMLLRKFSLLFSDNCVTIAVLFHIWKKKHLILIANLEACRIQSFIRCYDLLTTGKYISCRVLQGHKLLQ